VPYTSEIEKLEHRYNENPKGRNFAPLADAYRKAGQVDLAIDLCRKGLELHPDYISAYIVYGRCMLDKKDDPGAEEVFRKVMTLDPENVLALKILADVAARNNRMEQAVEWLGKLLAVDPMNGDAAEALARAKTKAAAVAAKPTVPIVEPATVAEPALVDLEPTSIADTPTRPMKKLEFEVERASSADVAPLAAAQQTPSDIEVFDGALNANPDAHAAAKAEGLEVEEDVELKAEPAALEGLARTQYEGSGMFKVDAAPAEDDLPQVDLPLIMPEDIEPAPRPKPPPPPPPPPQPAAQKPPPRAAPPPPAAVALSDDEGAADVAALSRVEPVLTETMAELYLKQGHREDALRVYESLLAKRPGDARLAARVAELSRPAAPRKAAGAGGGGGQSVGAFLKGILTGKPGAPAPAPPASSVGGGTTLEQAFAADEAAAVEGGDDSGPGAPTRPAADDISLDSVFGDSPRDSMSAPPAPEPAPANPSAAQPQTAAPATGGFSFDQFFATPGKGGGPEGSAASGTPPARSSGRQARPAPEEERELDQFQSWLKGLKS